MKKIYLALFAVALSFAPTLSINAQDDMDAPMGPPPGEQMDGQRRMPRMKQMTTEERTAKMVEVMELNDEQAAQVKALNEKYESTFQMPKMGRPEEMPDSLKNLSKEEMKAKMDAQMKEMRKQREAFNQELKALVGDEKYAKYEEYQKSQRPQRRGGNRGNRN